jgi:hypothetical protein
LTVDEESSTNVIELLDRNDPVLGLQSLRLTVIARSIDVASGFEGTAGLG